MNAKHRRDDDRIEKPFAIVPKSAREVFHLRIDHSDGSAKIELQIVKRRPNGRMEETPKRLKIPYASIDEICKALEAAKRRLCAGAILRPLDE